jgi:antitoxin HicB
MGAVKHSATYPPSASWIQTPHISLAKRIILDTLMLIRLWPCKEKMPTTKPKKNPHDGTTLDVFLEAEGISEEVQAAALKRAMALRIADLMEEKEIKKTALAKRMHTSRAALDRLLDPSNPSVTLATLTRASAALGHRVKIELVPA